jgi:hypothetical protein
MTTTSAQAPPAAAAPDKPTGPAAAATLATGIGVLALGILTTWSEASADFADNLQCNDRVGPLSGKTIISVIVFFAAWLVLFGLWRGKNPPLRTVIVVTLVLLVLGFIGTFPTFFEAFAD